MDLIILIAGLKEQPDQTQASKNGPLGFPEPARFTYDRDSKKVIALKPFS